MFKTRYDVSTDCGAYENGSNMRESSLCLRKALDKDFKQDVALGLFRFSETRFSVAGETKFQITE